MTRLVGSRDRPDLPLRRGPDSGRHAIASIRWAGLVLGPVLAVVAYLLLPSDPSAGGLTDAGRVTAAVAVWMATWWLTEATEVYVTALLPIPLLPTLGATSMAEAASPYAHELIFVLLGGFVLARSLQKWHLDRRIALMTLRLVGLKPARLVGGVMLATAAMSMWVSNTATAAMMVPVALSVIALVMPENAEGVLADLTKDREGRNFAIATLLGVAYGASIGGIGTLIGSPPNLFVVSYLRDRYGYEVGFAEWMLIGIPVVAVFLPLAWLLLTRVLYPIRITIPEHEAGMFQAAYAALGRPSRGEVATFTVFCLTASAWITRPLLVRIEIFGATPLAGLTDAGIAVLAAVALFVIPVDVRARRFVMDWETAIGLPWGVLILVGGGLSLAAALDVNGVGGFIAAWVSGVGTAPTIVAVLAVAALVVFLTELTSNTATTAVLVPVLAGIAPGLGIDPVALIVPVAIAASAAFMMPIATPPNAIVFGSGYITVPQMARAGFLLNLISIAIVTAATLTLVPLVFQL
jgi:solute carrier family 13 (sodium-dependent dicarboxylate transporter), member 2/3/5